MRADIEKAIRGGARLSQQPVVVVCNRIKAARLQLNWSMRQLAKAAGISPATTCRVEMGKEPTLTNALKIAAALKYPVEELWYLENGRKP